MFSSISGLKTMENYDHGDLTDIVRSHGGKSSSSHSQSSFSDNFMFFSSAMEEPKICSFGDPFSNIQDPFLHHDELNNISRSSSYFNGRNKSAEVFIRSSSPADSIVLSEGILEDDMLMRRSMPCNNSMSSNMIPISPNAKLPLSPCDSPAAVVTGASPAEIYTASNVVSGSVINANSSKDCLVDNTGIQIYSPRNPGIKRRKSQERQVVCIPAPAAGNSRQPSRGDVVPSDLWAWRKYGQKPIKGSPYPRGYYRCSSSKGCSARKQVERSRTDPSMFVITYTSEHNHPWPTQRNALAGTTRNAHPSKNNNSTSSLKIDNSDIISQKPRNPREEGGQSPLIASNNSVTEEIMEDIEKQQQLQSMDEEESNDGLSCKPHVIECNQSEGLSAEWGEIGIDPLNLVFTGQGFSAGNIVRTDISKALDPFHLFDWSAHNSTDTNFL